MDLGHDEGMNSKQRKTQAWVAKQSQRWQSDHDRIFEAVRTTGDFDNFQSALRCLSQQNYEQMNHYINLMVQGTAVVNIKISNDITNNKAEGVIPSDSVNTPLEIKKTHKPKNESKDQKEVLIESIDSSESHSSDSEGDESIEDQEKILDTSFKPSSSKSGGRYKKRYFGDFRGVPNVERRNITADSLTLDLVENRDDTGFELCDPAICKSCKALPYPELPKVMPHCVIVYAGPGSGKTECIRRLRDKYGMRITIRDTDHIRIGEIIPSHSILFTNRPDILMKSEGLKIAFLPYRRHWIRQCSSKCPGTLDSWYDDVVNLLSSCVLIRKNCYLYEAIQFRMD